jgi:hypothetical protein
MQKINKDISIPNKISMLFDTVYESEIHSKSCDVRLKSFESFIKPFIKINKFSKGSKDL